MRILTRTLTRTLALGLLVTAMLVEGALFISARTSLASAPDAWDELFARAAERCRNGAASSIAGATVFDPPVLFDDTVLLLVEGTWPQPHMMQTKARLLCLYDKGSGRITLAEQPPEWLAPVKEPD